jgi:16S rRNA (adenine1518-N6/adenine1519-N6)-dimethyltransferase
MYELTNPDTIQSLLKKHNFAPNKFLGQNFLIDEEVLDRIVETADIKEGDNVIEIGPGLGVLTQALLAKGANVVAIEKDIDLVPVVKENLKEFKNVKISNDDFLAIDLDELVSGFEGKSYKIVSNIPYYITSPVLRKILTAETKPQEIVFLVQREVAERISANPGDMSVISVFVQFYGTPSVEKVVKPESFWPAPKVESAILKIILDKKPQLEDDELKAFWRLVKIGYSSRRKTLANNLAAGLHIRPVEIRETLKKLGFSDKTRAQELTMEDWLRLAKNL